MDDDGSAGPRLTLIKTLGTIPRTDGSEVRFEIQQPEGGGPPILSQRIWRNGLPLSRRGVSYRNLEVSAAAIELIRALDWFREYERARRLERDAGPAWRRREELERDLARQQAEPSLPRGMRRRDATAVRD